MELCERYAAGVLSREQLIDELTRWEYVPAIKHDPYEDLAIQPPGTSWDVYYAAMRGLIEMDLYGVIAERLPADSGE